MLLWKPTRRSSSHRVFTVHSRHSDAVPVPRVSGLAMRPFLDWIDIAPSMFPSRVAVGGHRFHDDRDARRDPHLRDAADEEVVLLTCQAGRYGPSEAVAFVLAIPGGRAAGRSAGARGPGPQPHPTIGTQPGWSVIESVDFLSVAVCSQLSKAPDQCKRRRGLWHAEVAGRWHRRRSEHVSSVDRGTSLRIRLMTGSPHDLPRQVNPVGFHRRVHQVQRPDLVPPWALPSDDLDLDRQDAERFLRRAVDRADVGELLFAWAVGRRSDPRQRVISRSNSAQGDDSGGRPPKTIGRCWHQWRDRQLGPLVQAGRVKWAGVAGSPLPMVPGRPAASDRGGTAADGAGAEAELPPRRSGSSHTDPDAGPSGRIATAALPSRTSLPGTGIFHRPTPCS